MAILQEIKVPLISVNDTSLTVVEMLFADGNQVKKGDIIIVFETSKTTYNVEAESTGYIQYLCDQGNDYDVNDVVAKIFSDASEVEKKVIQSKSNKKDTVKSAIVIAAQTWEGDTLFSAGALALIESKKVDKKNFSGKDFVSLQDVEEVLGIAKKKNVEVSKNKSKNKETSLSIGNEKVIIEKLSSNKKREIDYLSEVQSTGLTSTINTIVETEGIFVYINQSLKILKNSLLPVIIYETARLLEKYPELNSYFADTAIAQYKQVNVGFAIDIDKGLKVLKIADTSKKTINIIEEEIVELSGKYIDNILQVDELTDITFTITDLSSESVTFFRPLINMMNSAILGVSSIDEKLQRCILSVTFDHRVTEGKRVAQFLKDLKDRLESYRSVYHPKLNQNITCFKCFKTLKEDLSDVGFAKCISPDGNEGYICQSCLKGF
ncbi:MAG TPA: 2-oxo acid dehydrogenase subunit E2 [Ferruginibacter sp.]|jgi:pyruvate/2-oxoglutarate dehydrogenase complex dihydrolipoamide acyltransferase (E2) component|nr:2-oxo acid dehydrogenase subunit E2 [Ferruginibacter sp.]